MSLISDDNTTKHSMNDLGLGGGGTASTNLISIEQLSVSSKSLTGSSSSSSSSSSARSSSSSSRSSSSSVGGKNVSNQQQQQQQQQSMTKQQNLMKQHQHMARTNGSTNVNGKLYIQQYDHETIMCALCKNKLHEPKLLNCLHSFCKTCLVSYAKSIDSNCVPCPKCKQDTLINGLNGLESLEDDYVMNNILDMIAIDERMLDCTSCKTEEKAVARCSDCAEFLCPNCVSAHQFMRCFENHVVVKFDDIKSHYQTNLSKLNGLHASNAQQTNSDGESQFNPSAKIGLNKSPSSLLLSSSSSSSSSNSTSSASSSSSKINEDGSSPGGSSCSSFTNRLVIDCGVPIHKPLYCKMHPRESLKFFCNSCQVPICSECIVGSHPQPMHAYERLVDAEVHNLEELEAYLKKAKENMHNCNSEYQILDQYLSELQEQLESSKSLIEETYQSYKAILEKRRDDLIKELEEKHSNKELVIMELHNTIDTSISKLNDVIKFAERIVHNGNTSEILLLKKSIISQVKYLLNSLPQLDNFDLSLKFVSDEKKFERAVADSFGRFYTQKELKQNYLNNLTLMGNASTNTNTSTITSSNNNNNTLTASSNQLEPTANQRLLEQDWLLLNLLSSNQQQPNAINLQQQLNSFKSINFHDNLLKNLSQLNGMTQQQHQPQQQQQQGPTGQQQSITPISPTASLNDEWLSNIVNKVPPSSVPFGANFDDKSTVGHFAMSPKAPTTATTGSQWSKSTSSSHPQQQQLMLNNIHPNTYLSVRAQSPFDTSPLGLMGSQSSRSQTPANLANLLPMGNLKIGGTNGTNDPSASSGSSTSSGAMLGAASTNHLLNGFDDLLPFTGHPTAAQNLNHLSKMAVTPGQQQQQQQQANALNNLNDLATLSNLNELALTAGLNLNLQSYGPNAPAAVEPNSSSQSPHLVGAIGSGLAGLAAAANGAFSGNGNLNPPVRQNGKMSNMQIRTKFGVLGSGKAQFNSPHGFCLGIDEEIIVADTNNHRIQVFDKQGDFKYSFGSPGREEGQLWYPRKVTVMRDSGKFVVCDRGNERSRMQIFNKNGHFIKKISIRYIDIVAGLGITQNGEIVAVDSVSPTVFRISENGDLLKWFDCSDYMREPSDIAISGNEYYVCDFKGHCVVVFNEDGTFMRRIGGENITNFPNGIDVSDAGDVLVGDSHGNRFHVAVFGRDGQMISEFECPYVKVSRCCGLKITTEGYVVTLAKNNHHVLVLNTLYVN